MKRAFLIACIIFICSLAISDAQITPTNAFSNGQVISATTMNENFDDLGGSALKRDGSGTITGNVAVDAGITIDGVDISEINVNALDKTGDTITGNIAVDAGITIDGADVGAYLSGNNVIAQDSGAVGDPSFSWTSTSSNTGMYLAATDQIGFSANGTAAMRIVTDTNIWFGSDSTIAGQIEATNAAAGGTNIVIDNTNAGAADVWLELVLDGTSVWAAGIDDSDSDKYVISSGGTIGTSNALELDSSLDLTVPGGQVTQLAGNGSGTVTVGGILFTDDTQQATTGTAEEILVTHTIVANTFDTDGRSMRITAYGSFTPAATDKTLRIRFGGIGGTIIAGGTIQNDVALETWIIEGLVVRLGSASQRGVGSLILGRTGATGVNTMGVIVTTAAETMSGEITLVITGESATTGQITYEGSIVEFLN